MKNIGEVIYLVKNYIVDDSMDICEQFLSKSQFLIDHNVYSIYDIAIQFDVGCVKLKCQDWIKKNTDIGFQSKDFHKCSQLVLGEIVKSNELSCTKSELFLACMDWVKEVSGQNELCTKEMVRHHMGDLFYEIRFGAMNIQEVSVLLHAYGHLFTADEYREINLMIGSNEYQPKMFKKNAREICEEFDWDPDFD